MAEVYEITERISELVSSWPERWGDVRSENAIGVLTPYADQVSRIRSKLRMKGLSYVPVERVLNVQGKQFRVVFLSTVRTHKPWVTILPEAVGNEVDFGFFSNPKMLNTALTRSQSLVAVVGDPVSLCTVGKCRFIWKDFIKICRDNSSLHGISYTQMKESLDGTKNRVKWGLNPLAKEFSPIGQIHQNVVQQPSPNPVQEIYTVVTTLAGPACVISTTAPTLPAFLNNNWRAQYLQSDNRPSVNIPSQAAPIRIPSHFQQRTLQEHTSAPLNHLYPAPVTFPQYPNAAPVFMPIFTNPPLVYRAPYVSSVVLTSQQIHPSNQVVSSLTQQRFSSAYLPREPMSDPQPYNPRAQYAKPLMATPNRIAPPMYQNPHPDHVTMATSHSSQSPRISTGIVEGMPLLYARNEPNVAQTVLQQRPQHPIYSNPTNNINSVPPDLRASAIASFSSEDFETMNRALTYYATATGNETAHGVRNKLSLHAPSDSERLPRQSSASYNASHTTNTIQFGVPMQSGLTRPYTNLLPKPMTQVAHENVPERTRQHNTWSSRPVYPGEIDRPRQVSMRSLLDINFENNFVANASLQRVNPAASLFDAQMSQMHSLAPSQSPLRARTPISTLRFNNHSVEMEHSAGRSYATVVKQVGTTAAVGSSPFQTNTFKPNSNDFQPSISNATPNKTYNPRNNEPSQNKSSSNAKEDIKSPAKHRRK